MSEIVSLIIGLGILYLSLMEGRYGIRIFWISEYDLCLLSRQMVKIRFGCLLCIYKRDLFISKLWLRNLPSKGVSWIIQDQKDVFQFRL